jgi:hypothetical protein
MLSDLTRTDVLITNVTIIDGRRRDGQHHHQLATMSSLSSSTGDDDTTVMPSMVDNQQGPCDGGRPMICTIGKLGWYLDKR